MYNPITKDGSSVDPADDGTRHLRPEDGDPLEVELLSPSPILYWAFYSLKP